MKNLKILGTGCPKCKQLAEMTDKAAKELNIEYEIEKVTEIQDILSYGVMSTPALVVDEEVKVTGKVPTIEEIKKMLS
ncbi:MAG TPA: thioredoxin family protein [Candidatus Wallbacteria bacterium]|nr:thioredoxin family protein [Candidatus Wallbacteria bacterium]